jgi:hypothetical protein
MTDTYKLRHAELAYELGERVADRYSGICSKLVEGVTAYQWKCAACTDRGPLVPQPTREQYDAIRAELAKHERGHAKEERHGSDR